MRAYRGRVVEGKVVVEGRLPEGAVVTVTIGEAAYLRAKLRQALRRNPLRRARAPAAQPTSG